MTALYIYPDSEHANETIIKVVGMLVEGDEFLLHAEVSPPWMRVVAHNPQEVVTSLRSAGVRVEVRPE
jgi:hypothetical protein